MNPDLSGLLNEFKDISLDDLPARLPPLRDIQHAIDVILGSPFPNLPRYRMNLSKHKELNKRIKGLLQKGLIQHSLSPYVVHALLTPKKHISWRMYIDSVPINKMAIN